MPSFYPMSRLPPTPPEFVPQYGNQGCGGHAQYQPSTYQAQVPPQHLGRQEETRYEYAHRYGQPPSVAAPTVVSYQQPPSYNIPPANVPQSNRYYESVRAPILPPMRTYDPAAYATAGQQQRRQEPQAKEEKPVGGVSATLDYDMEMMTDFVAEMSQRLITLNTKTTVEPAYRKWVNSVLTATRLPSATILLGLHYLATHINIRGGIRTADEDIHRAVTVALILGSKFLDDNTFINRSWAEVSYISVHTLNHLELKWLQEIDFQLHQVAKDPKGWSTWQERWKQFVTDKMALIPGTVKPFSSTKLSPLDTNVQRPAQRQSMFSPATAAPTAPQSLRYSRSSIHGTLPEYSSKPAAAQYPPAYSQYDAWGAPRSAVEISPRSAPHTGPTTPEYYGGSNIWAPSEGYNRRSMFGFQSQLHAPPHYGIPPPPYTQTPVTPMHSQNIWSGHESSCQCYTCRKGGGFLIAPQYMASQVVVG